MRVIFVHGFGGRRYDHEYVEAMRKRARKLRFELPFETFPWESGIIRMDSLGREWDEAKLKASDAARALANDIVISHADNSLYLVGFSLGARVVIECAEALVARSIPIGGLFVLGGAIAHTYAINRIARAARHGLLNYFSPEKDHVLHVTYRAEEGVPAAGSVGFTDGASSPGAVHNYRVAHPHVFHSAYELVATTVAEIIAWWEHIEIPGGLTENVEARTFGGHKHWDEVLREGRYLVQRLTHLRHPYRLLDVQDDDRRLARAYTLAPLLRELKVLSSGD